MDQLGKSDFTESYYMPHEPENFTNLSDYTSTFSENNGLPPELTEISENSLVCVFAYCLVFFIATSGNIIVIISLFQAQQFQTKHTRISLLLLHLSLADLIVCCTLIPTEIYWRLTIQWRIGDLMCKLTQFLRAFCLYLSSLILICVSVDRFLAILFPLFVMRTGSNQRIKIMLSVAWISAALFSGPQAIFFGVEPHPRYESFKQCVTKTELFRSKFVKIYSIFSLAVMYFLPLFVIVSTYTAIIIKLVRKSRKQCPNQNVEQRDSIGGNCHVSIYRGRDSIVSSDILDGNGTNSIIQLRCSSNADANMSRAKSRTLLMTIVIVIAFVFCWTPYAVMTLWYMIDWKGAAEVDPRVQDALFLMVVANSCINPLIYRSFTFKRGSGERCCVNL